MKHIHIDEFAKLNSPFHRLDPRAKAIAVFVFIFMAVSMTQTLPLTASVLFWSAVLVISRVPLGYVVRRITWILPFAGFLILFFPFITPGDIIWSGSIGFVNINATTQGIDRAVMLLLRVMVSILGLISLMATTRFNSLLKALNDLRVPGIILQMVEFTIRYIFVTIDELKRMRRARKSRGFLSGKGIWNFNALKILAQMIGTMFIRAYERGDRVYVAMLSRGFSGQIKTIHHYSLLPKDYIIAGGILLVAVFLLAYDKGVFTG